MKAFCLAIGIISAAVPACANEMSAPKDKVLIEQSRASRLYNQERFTALENIQKTDDSDTQQLIAEHQAVVDSARSERVRKLVKAALLEVERAAVGAEKIRYKIRVSCRTKGQVMRNPIDAAIAMNSETPIVATKTESCKVWLKIARTPRRAEPKMQDFAITLPDLAPAASY